MSRLLAVKRDGQSIWLDFIERKLMQSGELAKMVEADGICGLTSNPAIFQTAIGNGTDYDAALADILHHVDAEPIELFEALAIDDIRQAADILSQVYDATNAVDGYVSLEVSPHLSRDTAGTLDAARRLWMSVDRRNLMIKVPGTPEAVPAIKQLISEGINVNVTLLFARDAYRAAANAYIDGVEALAKAGGDVTRIASVASFFVSRIDAAIDVRLEKRIDENAQDAEVCRGLLGKVAIANAKLAYQDYLEFFDRNERWQKLKAQGAHVQRLLWASTGSKNPKYRDVVYMEELIGPDTVNTVPPATLEAFRDHGESRQALTQDVDAARATISTLDKAGISLSAVTDKLLEEGLVSFADADDQLMGAIAGKRAHLLGARQLQSSFHLGDQLQSALEAETRDWTKTGKLRCFWSRDSSLWTGADEATWMDWLNCPFWPPGNPMPLRQFVADIRDERFTTVLLIGMGGSSLGPEVLSKILGGSRSGLALHVIDSTDPAQIAHCASQLDPAYTLFIVASKSGSTLEPDILMRYFHAQASKALGADASRHFVAITDPGSKLEAFAREQGFRQIFAGVPGIGGRYSVLSYFGLVPAAMMELNVESLLSEAEKMANSCGVSTVPAWNPGVQLGLALGLAAKAGRDKLTLIADPELAPFGTWVEQLVAESTGKHGKGIIPVVLEPVVTPRAYGDDRIFVYLQLHNDAFTVQETNVAALQAVGQPVIRIRFSSKEQIAQAFYLWEIATAVAGSVLGINPFDQPDVEAAKIQTKVLMSAFERDNALPEMAPSLVDGRFALYGVSANHAQNLGVALQTLLTQLCPGDYFALLAYIPMNDTNQALLQEIRRTVRDACRVATCVGFGPRFLHSTGQLYKGGPNSGVFLQITCDDPQDLAIPDRPYRFGTVKAAQAMGDLQVLVNRHRRALRVHISGDLLTGLNLLRASVFNAANRLLSAWEEQSRALL